MNKKQKPDELMKTKRITIRLTEMQYELIEKRASDARLTIADYLRTQAIEGSVPISYDIVVDMPEIKQIAKDLNGACNNLNQLTKFFQSGGVRSMQMQAQVNACINSIFEIRDTLARLEGDLHGHH